MQLTCPNCGARYRVDASQWPTEAGPDGSLRFRPRKARCKLCATVFEAVPEEEILELDDPVETPAAGAAVRAATAPAPAAPPEPDADAAPALATAGASPIEAAWPAVSGWPEPRAPGVIHFEAPPVPLPATATTAAGPRATVRLPGPGALGAATVQPVVAAGADAGAVPAPAPVPPPDPVVEAGDALPDDPDEEADTERRLRWPWVLGALLVAGGLWWWLVASGRVDPVDYGLPPYDATRLPGWAQPAAALVGGLPKPALSVPAIALPRTPPPPLAVAAEAVRRPLGDDRQVWEISATVSNPTDDALGVPPVELLLLDSAGRTVGRWTVRPEAAWLPPGGSTRFETSAIAPPAGAERVRVQLKPSEPGRL